MAARANDRPNLLFITADQHRHDWLSCAGTTGVRTPYLDSLAARGIRFTHCATPAPLCTPARIALATGLLPHRLGALTNAAYLPAGQATYYQRLRDYGYHVACVGKLDLAKSDTYNGVRGDRPRAYGWGFTHPVETEGKMHAGSSATPIGPYTAWLAERGLLQAFHDDYRRRREGGWHLGGSWDSVLPADAFEDSWIARRAAEWIDDHPGDFPWHMYVSFVGPHDPYDPPTEYGDRFRRSRMPRAIKDDLAGKPAWIRDRAVSSEEEGVEAVRRQYTAALAAIDDGIGIVLDAVARRGWLENTIVVYSSDHGEMLGDHGLWTKHCAYDASHRVPLIVAGPGIAGGRTSGALVELEDIGPTLCDLAGVPPLERIDGRSFLPVIRGESDAHREDVVAIEQNYRALRTASHLYVANLNDRSELYDFAANPGEVRNVAEENPSLAGTLARQLHNRLIEGEHLR